MIAQFNQVDQRNDIGQLWENFIIVERMKWLAYSSTYANLYFWRTYDQQEIDLVEEHGEALHGYEFKWSVKKHLPAPKSWLNTYPNAEYSVINSHNYQDYILPSP